MYVKLPPRDFNPGSYPPHPTSTYTYRVTISSRICDDILFHYKLPNEPLKGY